MTQRSDSHLRRIRAVLIADTEEFSDLLALSGLDPRISFRGADLRHVDFGTADLSTFDLSYADVRGADFSCTTGLEKAVLDGLIFDRSTKGLPLSVLELTLNHTDASEPHGAYNKTEAQNMLVDGIKIPHDWISFTTRLDLSLSDLDSLDGLSELVYLQELNVTATGISDIGPLRSLKALRNLLLAETSIADLQPLSNLARLQRLKVSGTNIIDLTPLKGLSNLRFLDLSRTLVSDISHLRHLQNLRELYLSYTKVFDLRPLAALHELQILDITDTPVVEREIQKLRIPIIYANSGIYYSTIKGMKRPGVLYHS